MSRWRAFRQRDVRLRRVVLGNQVHGVEVETVGTGAGLDPGRGHRWLGHHARPASSSPSPSPIAFRSTSLAPGRGVALLHAAGGARPAGSWRAGLERLAGGAGAGPADVIMHCGVGICGPCYEVGSEVMPAAALPADGPGPVAPRSAGAPGRRRRRGSGIGDVTVSAWCSRPRPRLLLQPPRLRGTRRPDGRLSRDAPARAALTLTLGADDVAFTRCPGGAWSGRLLDVGEFPHIFFPAIPDVCRRAARSHSRSHRRPRLRAGRSAANRDRWSAPSCRYGWTARTADPARDHGRRLRRDQPVPRAIPGIQGAGRPAVRAGGVVARARAAAALARALAPLRRSAGAGAGRRRSAGGGRWRSWPCPMTST